MGSVFSTRRRTDAVQPDSSSAARGKLVAVWSIAPGSPSLLIAGFLPPMRRERSDQREDEEQHHDADEDEVRQRNENESPVNVWGRRVHWQPPCSLGVFSASMRVHSHDMERPDVSGCR